MDRFFFSLILCFSLPLFSAQYSSSAHLPVSASCKICCVVEDSAEWVVDSKSLNTADNESEDALSGERESLMLYTNSDIEIITAGPGTASLSNDGCSLSNRYIIHYKAAVKEAGDSVITAWNDCDFGFEVIYVPGNCASEVILSLSAGKNTSASERIELSSRTQILIVCWK